MLRDKICLPLTGLATAPQIKTANTAADPITIDREIILIKFNKKLMNVKEVNAICLRCGHANGKLGCDVDQ